MSGLVHRATDPLVHGMPLHGDEQPGFVLCLDQSAQWENELDPQNLLALLQCVIAEANMIASNHCAECDIVDKEVLCSIGIDPATHDATPQRPVDYRAFDSGHSEHAHLPPCSTGPMQPQRAGVDYGDISEAIGNPELYALRNLHIQAQVVLGRSAERKFLASTRAVSSLQIKTARALGTGSPLNTTVTIFPSSRLTSDELNSRVTMGDCA